MSVPTDPSIAQSAYGNSLIGDIYKIWSEYSGNGVHVGVYDNGVEYTHEDLAGNYDPSLHFQYNGTTYDPFPLTGSDAHGTSCAGIIGAVPNNGLGGAGIAFGSSLTGVNFLGDIQYLSGEILLASLEWAQNFDVMSNSWGRTPGFFANQSLDGSFRGEMADAYGVAEANGRGGLGTIINQAAGNDDLDANGDGLNASRYTNTIAATGLDGAVESYSNYGASILVAAPISAITTDRTGSDGYDSGNYVSGFNGTSAATPVVSGVTALMLEANSNLGWRDVQNILANSASHTGSAYGAGATGDENGAWMETGGGGWNGGGHWISPSYGFGMVDAFAAVRMAEAWSLFQGAQTSANEQVRSVSSGILDTPINDLGAVEYSYDFGAASLLKVEHIAITVDITHEDFFDLVMTLIAPDGTEIVFNYGDESGEVTLNPTVAQGGLTFTMGIDQLRGYDLNGQWTVRIEDTTSGHSGTLHSISAVAYGSAANANDVYTYTDDFGDVAALDGSRRTLVDNDGGINWINMSALTGNLVANLMAQKISDGTTSYVTSISGIIHNIVTGDGNDTITGNSANNYLVGMRGNDTLEGRLGADALSGGQGADMADYAHSASAVQVRLFNGTGLYGDAQGDLYISIENARGSNFNDTLIGTAYANSLLGGGGNDSLYGLGGNDYLSGWSGADILDGGAGSDTVSYAGSNAVLVRLYNGTALYGHAQGDTLVSIENVIGSSSNDVIVGTDWTNTLRGGAGNDALSGRAGADLLDGGTGNDTALYNGSNAVLVKLYAGTGQFGDAQGDTLISIENVVGSSFNDTIIGGNGTSLAGEIDNKLDGGAGNDALFGLAGNDILIGGAGADALDGGDDADFASYEGSNAGVTVRLFNGTASGGHATGDTFTSIEGLIGSSHNDTLFGDAANNDLRGGAGNDYINGMGGDDTIRGGAAADILDGGAGNDTVDYTGSSAGVTVRLFNQTATGGDATGDIISNFESVQGSDFNDTIIGGSATGGGILSGGGGNDYINGLGSAYEYIFGEAGADLLEGGAGSDYFGYWEISDSTVAVSGRDRIVNFSHADGDIIYLAPMDANSLVAGDQDFSFLGTGAYTGIAGQLRYVQGGGTTMILGDIDGDMVSDFAIALDGTINLVSSDFAL